MIEFKNVSKVYNNGTEALRNLSLSIAKGEFVFIVGSSGAGKSTFLKLIMREEVPNSGEIVVNGRKLSTVRKRDVPYLRRTMGIVFQDFRLIDKMTVYDNVAFAMHIVGASDREIRKRVPYVLGLVGLEKKMDNHPAELSGGEQQMLAMGRALMSKPKLLLLDEPSMGLSPLLVSEIFNIIQEINKQGMTILLVEQNAKKALSIANRGYVLETGNIVKENDAQALLHDESIRKAYLGE